MWNCSYGVFFPLRLSQPVVIPLNHTILLVISIQTEILKSHEAYYFYFFFFLLLPPIESTLDTVNEFAVETSSSFKNTQDDHVPLQNLHLLSSFFILDYMTHTALQI